MNDYLELLYSYKSKINLQKDNRQVIFHLGKDDLLEVSVFEGMARPINRVIDLMNEPHKVKALINDLQSFVTLNEVAA